MIFSEISLNFKDFKIPSHDLQIHFTAHAWLYSFNQNILIWFVLGAWYNRKRARNEPRGGKAAGLYDGQGSPSPTHIYLEHFCMCAPNSAPYHSPTLASVRTLSGRPMKEGLHQFTGKGTRSLACAHARGELCSLASFSAVTACWDVDKLLCTCTRL